MQTPKRNPEVVDAVSLNKFLMGLHNQLRNKELTVEEAEAHSKIADKIIKHNLVRVMYMKAKSSDSEIEFFENNLLIEKLK